MDTVWKEILQLALNQLVERSNAPVVGAKLRSAVAQIAHDRCLEFPPPGIRKFSDLVDAFPSDFIVQRNPGSDILVVPTIRAELLAAESPHAVSSSVRIRQDIFDALTLVPQPAAYGLPYYDPSNDKVLYIKEGENCPSNVIALPTTSLENEIHLRREFIAEAKLNGPSGSALTSSLSTSAPLRLFGSTIQEFGLAKRWHTFRVAHLAKRMREWSVQEALAWQVSWIDASEPRFVTPSSSTIRVNPVEKQQLIDLASVLTAEDISRITIPLDIVLRLLSNK
jgi:hypothetical protein